VFLALSLTTIFAVLVATSLGVNVTYSVQLVPAAKLPGDGSAANGRQLFAPVAKAKSLAFAPIIAMEPIV
jgi:hypothetical protein